MKVAFILIAYHFTCLITAQPLFLYSTSGPPGGYLLTKYTNDRNELESQVVTADTFSVRLKDHSCEVTMSNAYVYQTRLSSASFPTKTNEIKQFRFHSASLKMSFPASTQLIFNNSVNFLSAFRPVETGKTNTLQKKAKTIEPPSSDMPLKPPAHH